MPVQSPTFFIPASMSSGTAGKHPYETNLTPPFILEDIFLRGGFRCLPSLSIRDKIPVASCKVGMVVYTPENDGKLWQITKIVGSTVEWSELKLSGSGGEYLSIDPIGITPDLEIFIDDDRILPKVQDKDGNPLAVVGNVVSLSTDLKPKWSNLSQSGITGFRETKSHRTAMLDAFDAPEETFILELGKFVALILVSVDIPDVLVECYTTSELYEPNPYRFISTEYQLTDQGITELVDGSFVKGRRFSFIANLDDPVTTKTYWRVKYLANTEASKDSDGAVIRYRQPTVTICYLVLEK